MDCAPARHNFASVIAYRGIAHVTLCVKRHSMRLRLGLTRLKFGIRLSIGVRGFVKLLYSYRFMDKANVWISVKKLNGFVGAC